MHDLKDRAILVTSRFEEANVRSKCEALGVRLIPKNMVEHVEIELMDRVGADRVIVLVDDDELIRSMWTERAASQNIKLRTFSTIGSFNEGVSAFDPIR